MEHNTSSPAPVGDESVKGRYLEVDVLKSAGILTVVLIHSVRAPWVSGVSATEIWLGLTTRFAVPAFLACSGFLYAAVARVPHATTLRRLRRILIPYLIASVAAQVWLFSYGPAPQNSSVVLDFLLGSSFGPYYYIFVLFWLVLITPLLALLPRFALGPLLVLLFLVQGFFESGSASGVPLIWSLRNPLLWWAYFVLGWVVRLNYDRLVSWIAGRRLGVVIALALAVVICTGVAGSEGPYVALRVGAWLNIYAILGLLFVLTCGRAGSPAPLRILSDGSYAIYLFHLFFVYGVQGYLRARHHEFDAATIALSWSAGLLGAMAVIGVMRALLGARARDAIGA